MSDGGTYDYRTGSSFSPADCQKAVGRDAVLPLTGRIVDIGASDAGPFVWFEIDERWGLAPGTRFGFDLNALTIADNEPCEAD